MSRPPGEGSTAARGISAAVLKGGLLIALAVLIGVFLVQRVDSGKASSTGASTASTKPKTTTTVRKPPAAATTTTTLPAGPAKTPDQVRVIVLNGGAPSGQAAKMRTQLLQAGYTNQPQANNWSGHQQTGNTVQCKAGLDREAVALSQQNALQGSKVAPFPNPVPTVVPSDADCVVVVGG